MAFTCTAIIFDLDGVLVDSNAISERHWERWAAEHGIPYEEVAHNHHGRPTVEIIRDVAPHLDAEAEARKKEEPEAMDTDGLVAFDGAAMLIDALPDGQWAIATSGRYRTATARLAHTGLPQPDTLVTADDVKQGKPAPDPYRLAAEQLGVDPRECLVFEDAPAGVESAHRAGARVIAVATTNPPDALAAADAVVDRLTEVTIASTGNGALRVQWREGA
jgi:sugar-phosphatase